jgi:hypothetical protein
MLAWMRRGAAPAMAGGRVSITSARRITAFQHDESPLRHPHGLVAASKVPSVWSRGANGSVGVLAAWLSPASLGEERCRFSRRQAPSYSQPCAEVHTGTTAVATMSPRASGYPIQKAARSAAWLAVHAVDAWRSGGRISAALTTVKVLMMDVLLDVDDARHSVEQEGRLCV